MLEPLVYLKAVNLWPYRLSMHKEKCYTGSVKLYNDVMYLHYFGN